MDPVSATLAVITFATAVKDIIELGQKIHESFAKVSSNFRSAARVAVDIKEMLEEINTFCEDHRDQLENMKDFKSAVCDLVGKLRTFEASVLPLLPKSGRRMPGKLIRGWDSWRKSSRIEASIAELQCDIVKVMRRHMLKSAMRTEVKLETIHQTANIGFADMKQDLSEVLDVVRRDVSALGIATATHHAATAPTDEEFDRKVIALAASSPSTSAPMLRSPTEITVDIINKKYIEWQIRDISSILERMAESRPLGTTSDEALLPVCEFWFSDDIYATRTMSALSLGNHIVRHITEIRAFLDPRRAHTISLPNALRALFELSAGLQRLAMDNEGMLVAQWTVKLARMHLRSYRGASEPTAMAHLALALINQSVCYSNADCHVEALQAAEEAHTLSHELQNSYPDQSDFVDLHAKMLIQYATLVDNHRSIDMLIAAVQLLDTILGVRTFTQDFEGIIEGIIEGDDVFFTQLLSAGQSSSILDSYATAIHALGEQLIIDTQHRTETDLYPIFRHCQSGTDLMLLGTSVYRVMVDANKPDHQHTDSLAKALLRTVCNGRGHGRGDFFPAEEAVEMADESSQLYRTLANDNPVFYARKQAEALLAKAQLLDGLHRRPEAIATLEEVATLSEQILQDKALHADALHRLANQFHELKRHHDAVRTMKVAITTYIHDAQAQAERYFLLGVDYARLQQHLEAMQALQTSVGVYRRLAMKSPEAWINHLGLILAHLAKSFVALGDYAEARTSWKESITILEKQISIASATHSKILGVVYSLSSLLEDKRDCVDLRGAVAKILRNMGRIATTSHEAHNAEALIEGEILLAHDYLRLGHPEDCERHLNDMITLLATPWRQNLASEHADLCVDACNLLKARALDEQGRTRQAIVAAREAHSNSKPLCLDDEDQFSVFIEATTYVAQLLTSLGEISEAQETASEALRVSRDADFRFKDVQLVWSLHAATHTALAVGKNNLARELAEEGCNICATEQMLQRWRECEENDLYIIFVRQRLMGLLSSALLRLDDVDKSLDWAQRAVDASLALRRIGRMRISASTAQKCYMESNGHLAIVLLASGQIPEARDILEKRREYFAQRVDRVMGNNRDLAPILLALSLLYCHEGRHEDGHAAGQELQSLLERLGIGFASLEKQVKIRLRQDYMGPPGRVLCDIEKGLTCGFHTNTCSLLQV